MRDAVGVKRLSKFRFSLFAMGVCVCVCVCVCFISLFTKENSYPFVLWSVGPILGVSGGDRERKKKMDRGNP